MNLDFRSFLERSELGYAEPYPNEVGMLRQLQSMPLDRQIALDQQLHRNAIRQGTFGDAGSAELAVDHGDKDVVARSLLGQGGDPARAVGIIQKDIVSHERYLSKPPSETTGSYPWHKAWIRVYQGWLQKLG